MNKWRCAAALSLVSVLVTGCARQEDSAFSAENPVTITVWSYYTGAQLEAFNSLIAEFNQTRGKELGITVQASSEGSVADLEQNVIAAANKEVGAKDVPNIFAAYTDNAYKIDRMGLVADLSPYFTEEEKAEYIDSYLAEGELDAGGSLKIFPVAKATEIFMMNQTDWEKFADATGASLDDLSTIEGLTETAEDYYEWTDSLTDEPDDGKAFFGRDAMANYMIIGAMQLGTEIISRDEAGNAVLDFPEDVVRKLWDNYYVPYINGYFSSVGRFRSDDVKTGNVISFVGSSASATYFPTEVILSDEVSYPIETGVMMAPEFAGGEAYAAQQGAGMVVTKGEEEEIEASVEFLKWLTDTDQNIQFSLASGYMPVKKEANSIDAVQEMTDTSEPVSQSLEISLATVNSNTMYSTAAIENGNTVRDILEYSMSDKAIEDRAEIVQMMSDGVSRSEAVAVYDTDENFRQWYEAVKAELEAEFK